MRLRLNGEVRDVPDGTRLAGLFESLGLDAAQVAAERNGELVPRSEWGALVLAEGDELEVVTLVGGG